MAAFTAVDAASANNNVVVVAEVDKRFHSFKIAQKLLSANSVTNAILS